MLLIARRGWLGWLIRRVTRSPYSHVALVDRTAAGIWLTVEAADLDGVGAKRLESYLEDASVTGLLLRDSSILSDQDRAEVMRAAWLRVGAGYDTLQLVGMYARRRMPWMFGGRARALAGNRLDSARRLICSELVTVAYQQGAGFALAPPGVGAGMVDPGHLARTARLVDLWRWGG